MENRDYNVLSDEELVSLSVGGDVVSTEILLKRYNGVVKQTARSFFLFGGDVEDLVQEGMLGVFKAIRAFNGETPFNAFAKLCIKRNILTAVKKGSRFKHHALNSSVDFSSIYSEDDTEYLFGDESLDPAVIFSEREEQNELDVQLKRILSSLEYEILKMYLDGYSYNEIAAALSKPQKSVDNALQRIRKKVEKEFKR